MFGYTPSGRLAAILAATAFLATPAIGQDVYALQVTASQTQANPSALSLEVLDGFDQVSFTTTTTWTDGEVEFSGVPVKTLLAQLNAEGETLKMIALNDYAVSMPVAELEDDAPIIATRMNGAPMSVRNKGPFWVVYPYDSDEKYQTETVYSRSIWQLNRLEVTN